MSIPNNETSVVVCGQTKNETSIEDFDRRSWVISVSLAVFAAIINNIGLNMQKLAWTRKQNNTSNRVTSYQFVWVVGMIFIILASVADFVALAFGPQSVIAPIGSLTMVTNAFIAPWMHGEKLHRHVVWATLIIILGCVLAVASASHSNDVCDINALFALYWTLRFMVYALSLVIIIVWVVLFIRKAENLIKTNGKDSAEYAKVFSFHRISYAFLSGLIGAQSVLFARSVDFLLVSTARGSRLFLYYPSTYLILFSLVASIFLQIYWLNQGLARFESLYNVPTFTSTWIVGTVLGGGIFYGEFAKFSATQAFFFPFGILLCCLGVMYLSFGANSAQVGDSSHHEDGGLKSSTTIEMQQDVTNRISPTHAYVKAEDVEQVLEFHDDEQQEEESLAGKKLKKNKQQNIF